MADRGEVEPHDAQPATEAASGSGDPLVLHALTRVGETLRDKWRLDVLIGVGGMAAVYAATHRNNSRVAVKIIHSEMSTNALVRERFLWEGYLANSVGHEGAVKVIDDDAAEDGSLFLVTELLDGETLEERRIRLGGRLPQNEVLVLTDQILSVLIAAHAKGIVHRDLKPDNVFLTRAGQVKILDFGIARLRQLSTASSVTQTGFTAGTPAYMAPEHARGLSDEVDERSDLWACGAIMFSLLAGRGVHEGRTMNEKLANAINRPAPPLASVAPDVSPPVADLIDRALEFAKDMRWSSAATMQKALHQAYQLVNGGEIEKAVAPTIGDDVPDRTLPQAVVGLPPDRRPPTTSGPFAASPVPMLSALSPRPWRAVLAVGGAAVLGFFLLVVASMVSGGRASTHAETASAAMPVVPPAMPTPVVLSPLAPLEISVTDLPVAGSARAGSQPGPTTRSASPATSVQTSPSPRADCRPPYVVDVATGKKQWKLECL